jgi:CRISPR-associated protein Csx14
LVLRSSAHTSVLIATLGSEAQVIPLAAQKLHLWGETLACVTVLHTNPAYEPIGPALGQLQVMMADALAWLPLHLVNLGTQDVLHPAALYHFGEQLFQTIKEAISQGHRVHLLLAGGRKPMAMLGMSVAQMLFGPGDRLWYLYSDEGLRRSGRHRLREGDHLELVAIPLPPLSDTPAAFRRSFQASSPNEALSLIESEHVERRRHFVEVELTPAERAVAKLVAEEVISVEEMARRLHKSPKTVTNQLTQIYRKLESYFGLQEEVGLKREFLRQELRGYFDE